MLKNQRGAVPIIIMLLFPVIILVGCAGVQLSGDVDQETLTLVKIATRNISCEIALSGDEEINNNVVGLYKAIKDGDLSGIALVKLSEITPDRPTLAADIADLISLLGVRIETNGDITGLDEVPEETFRAIETSWKQGQRMCSGELI